MSSYKDMYNQYMNSVSARYKRAYKSYFIKQLIRAYVIYLHQPTRYDNDLVNFLSYVLVDNNKVLYRMYKKQCEYGSATDVKLGLDKTNDRIVVGTVNAVIIQGYSVASVVLDRFVKYHRKYDSLDML